MIQHALQSMELVLKIDQLFQVWIRYIPQIPKIFHVISFSWHKFIWCFFFCLEAMLLLLNQGLSFFFFNQLYYDYKTTKLRWQYPFKCMSSVTPVKPYFNFAWAGSS